MNATIFIEGLTVYTQIGVYDWEKQIKQRLVFDLKMTWDCAKAIESDSVEDCLNYAAVSAFIQHYCDTHHYALLERLGAKLGDALRHTFQLSALDLTIRKPDAVKQANAVGVQFQWGSS